jgi:hypothetical protein
MDSQRLAVSKTLSEVASRQRCVVGPMHDPLPSVMNVRFAALFAMQIQT